MEWLQILMILAGSVGLGFAGYKLLGSGYRKQKSAATLTSNAPSSITLTAIGNDRWQKTSIANGIAAPFFQRGFQDGGCYSVRETPGTIVRFLVQPEEAIVLTLVEDSRANHWVEISTFYEDGTEWTYSNRVGDALLHRPGCTRYYAPKLPPESLYGKLKTERFRKKTRKVTVDNVNTEYATMWAAHQKWLKEQGKA